MQALQAIMRRAFWVVTAGTKARILVPRKLPTWSRQLHTFSYPQLWPCHLTLCCNQPPQHVACYRPALEHGRIIGKRPGLCKHSWLSHGRPSQAHLICFDSAEHCGVHPRTAARQACCLVQADRSGRADEHADAYQESALFQENISLLSQGRGTESRISITTIQVTCLQAHAFSE